MGEQGGPGYSVHRERGEAALSTRRSSRTLIVAQLTTGFMSVARLSHRVPSPPSAVICVEHSVSRLRPGEIITSSSTVHHRLPPTLKGFSADNLQARCILTPK